MKSLERLYQVVQQRQSQHEENSYTCYLFQQGIDKILKKCGEESSEVIIAAKNGDNSQTVEEIADLMYHLTVLMVQQNIPLAQLDEILEQRQQKIGNRKTQTISDPNS